MWLKTIFRLWKDRSHCSGKKIDADNHYFSFSRDVFLGIINTQHCVVKVTDTIMVS